MKKISFMKSKMSATYIKSRFSIDKDKKHHKVRENYHYTENIKVY